MSDKTEQPTPRRLRKARQEGDSPVSAALVTSVGFIGTLALAPAALEALVGRTGVLIRSALTEGLPPSPAALLAREVLWLSVPMLAAGAFGASLVGLLQTGGIVATRRVVPDLGRLDPLLGIRSLLNPTRSFALLRALLAAVLIGGAALVALEAYAADLAQATGNVDRGAALAALVLKRVAWSAALVMLGLAGLDLLITFRSWQERLRMSKDEVRREYRESEGDPELKVARRRAHEESLRGASISAVKEAAVLVVDPTGWATALAYDEARDQAPRVVAQGRGMLVRPLVEAADAYRIPVARDAAVARALGELLVGDAIPRALYQPIAEILRDAREQSDVR